MTDEQAALFAAVQTVARDVNHPTSGPRILRYANDYLKWLRDNHS